MNTFIEKALHGNMDSDRHLVSIFAMALASRGKVFVELGVREGHTTEPLYEAAKLNKGHLWSVDLNDPTKFKPNNAFIYKILAIEFLVYGFVKCLFPLLLFLIYSIKEDNSNP